ncbi:hypothetical protein [Thiohalospira halophila]|uniref:hypothetical protein n=1 Tax=Thiohalospira halophila TaxID=381300 RepID=UPI00118084D1|nr:hypothetical protein [Thiohalospira halophila]
MQLLLMLLPFVVGAIIALAGVMVGALFYHRLQARRERQRYLRAQVSDLVAQAYEVEYWLRQLRSARLLNGPPLEAPNPMKHVRTIAQLHVPELRPEVRKLARAVDEFEEWVNEGVTEKRNTRQVSDETLGRYAEVHRGVLDAITEIANRGQDLIREP